MQKIISLWDFSLVHYAKPQIADCCLQLQDNYGVNVNVLLWALWLESSNRLLTKESLQIALEAVARWDENYVQPLRRLRRAMKQEFANDVDQVRAQIKHAELLAEKQEQQWLEKLALEWPESLSAIAKGSNISFYLTWLNVPLAIIEQTKIHCDM